MLRPLRFFVLAAAAAVAILLFVVLRGEDERTASPNRPRASTGGSVEPMEIRLRTTGVRRVPIPQGRQVVLRVTGEPGEEIHVHGYDLKRRIGASGVVRMSFRATIPGRFEVEVEGSHRQIADLTVR